MAEWSLVNLPLDECHSTLLMISQHLLGNGLVPSRNKPLPDADLCRHMVSLCHNELRNDNYQQSHVRVRGWFIKTRSRRNTDIGNYCTSECIPFYQAPSEAQCLGMHMVIYFSSRCFAVREDCFSKWNINTDWRMFLKFIWISIQVWSEAQNNLFLLCFS